MTHEPLLLGHRGAPRLAEENTVAAFLGALEAGLDGLETDIQRTADGALVLHHDPVAHAGPFIASLPLADLRAMAPQVPVLADLLPLMSDFPSARLNLEVKTAAPYDDSRATDVAGALSRWPAAIRDRTWLSTFDPLLLLSLAHALSAAAVTVPLALLMASDTAERLLSVLPISAVHPHHSLVSPERVHGWHQCGWQVHTWTVNDHDLALRLMGAGVDGLIGDVPDALLAARAALQPVEAARNWL